MRSCFLIMVCILTGLLPVKGQIMVDSISDRLLLIGNKEVQALQTDLSTTFEEVRTDQSWEIYDFKNELTPQSALWLKIEIKNRSKVAIQTYLYSVVHEAIIYKQTTNGFEEIKNGYYVPLPQRTNKYQYYFTRLDFAPFEKTIIYLKLSGNKLSSPIELFSEKGYRTFSRINHHDQIKSITFIYFFIFSLFTLFIFVLVLWLKIRGKLYFYYLGYLFFLLIFGFIVLRKTLAPVGNIFQYAPKLSNDLNEPVQFIFIAFYIFFILNLLQVKIFDKLLARALSVLGIACLTYAVCRFFLNVFFFDLQMMPLIFNAVRLIILPINLILIFWIIFKVKHPLLNYFIIGQSFFFIGAVLGSYINYSGFEYIPNHFFGFKEASNIVFQMGLIGEVYCFSLALGKNVFLIQEEKERTDAALIKQYQEHEQLQTNMNRELDIKVHEKTTELIELYGLIEQEKEQKIKNEFTQKIKETEMIALRAQMNPHFIFNSINAIKNLILTSRNEDAISYLDDFSSLLRHILQNSNQSTITVEEELEILELYLSLEQDRMGKRFNYHINISSREELSQYQIPPLLLQPIVENAIWHGLHSSLKADKKLEIKFDTTDGLKIIIEDNGIGRAESAKNKKLHAAMGTAIIKERLALHNHLSDHNILLEINDLKKNGSGTQVILTYKY